MTVKEVAKKLGVSVHCIYKRIEQNRGIGKDFVRHSGGVYFIDGRKVK